MGGHDRTLMRSSWAEREKPSILALVQMLRTGFHPGVQRLHDSFLFALVEDQLDCLCTGLSLPAISQTHLSSGQLTFLRGMELSETRLSCV